MIRTSMHDRPKILSFINTFKRSNPKAMEEAFTRGNCYWFAKVMQTRFGGVILYHPVKGHFAFENDGLVFDITGQISRDGFKPWRSFILVEPTEYRRIYKTCVRLEAME